MLAPVAVWGDRVEMLRLGEVCRPDEAPAPADTFARHRRRWRWCDGEKSSDGSKSEWWAVGRSEVPGGRRGGFYGGERSSTDAHSWREAGVAT
jgi:hypothetical protein